MPWVTLIWSSVASACLTLAAVHFVVWLKDRSDRVHLLFSLAAIGVVGIAACELMLMRAQTPERFGLVMRWYHVPLFVLIVSTVGFVCLDFGTGRRWLAWTVCGLRVLILVINFSVATNFNYVRFTAVRPIEILWGATVSTGEGQLSARTQLGTFSSVLFLLFVVDASIRLWRKGTARQRERAILIGGSLSLFVFIGLIHTVLIFHGLLRSPYFISIAFLAPLVAMAYELGTDLVKTAQLARDLEASRGKLRDSEEQFRLAAQAASLGIWQWDAGVDQMLLPGRSRLLHGLNATAGPVTTEQFLDRIILEDRDKVRRSMADSLSQHRPFFQEYRVTLPSGQTRWISLRGQAHSNGTSSTDGDARILRGVCVDVSDRKRVEDRFRLVVEAAPFGMLVVGPEGRIVMVNEQAERIFGYERSELIGQQMDIVVSQRQPLEEHRADQRGFASAPSERAMGVGHETMGRRKDGSDVPVEVRLNPIGSPEGMFVLASIQDLTPRRQAEREAASQRNELAHLSRVTMLGELSGSLAHELNQPLTAILSNAQAAMRFLAQSNGENGEVREILADIIEADNRAGETIRRLRRLFRKGEVENQPIDVNGLIQEVLKILNSDLINNMVTAQTQLTADLPAIRGDRVQMQQVMINLVVNACDAMAETAVANRNAVLATKLDPDGNVLITVSDQGCGIPPDRIEEIFEPFVTSKGYGMGLGLAVCRTIVSAHGGRLWAVNNAERGASFHISLPAAAGAPEPVA